MTATLLAPALAILGGLLFFTGFWLLVTSVLTTLSGWPSLAATFPGGSRPAGRALWGQVIGMGPVQEKNVTAVIPAVSGLYLYPMALFRFRRPPVLVPWFRVRYVSSHQFLWSRWHKLDLGGITTINVRPALLSLLRDHGVAVPADALA